MVNSEILKDILRGVAFAGVIALLFYVIYNTPSNEVIVHNIINNQLQGGL